MYLLMLGTLAVAVLGDTLLVDHGMQQKVPICGGVSQPHCFSRLYSILPSEQSCQSSTCTTPNFPCGTWRFALSVMVLHTSIGMSSYGTWLKAVHADITVCAQVI